MNSLKNNRLARSFIKYTSIDSESFNEREFADVVKAELTELGLEVEEDNAGDKIGGNTGNIYGFLKGNVDAEPILFTAHMDTVKPGNGKEPQIDDEGKFTSKGETVLGSDDVSGIVEILEAIRRIKENGKDHGDIEVIFSVAEEQHCLGASAFDYSKLKSKIAYVMDMHGEIGTAAFQAPTLIVFDVEMTGRSAHAGFEPNMGINAIAATADAITKIEQGLLPNDITLNVGKICGGKATNIVSDFCECHGEIRGFDTEIVKARLGEVENRFMESAKAFGAECRFYTNTRFLSYCTPRDHEVSTLFEKGCRMSGMEPVFVNTKGASDNNIFDAKGIVGLVLACGMQNIHTTDEYVYLKDMEKATEIVYNIILAAADK